LVIIKKYYSRVLTFNVYYYILLHNDLFKSIVFKNVNLTLFRNNTIKFNIETKQLAADRSSLFRIIFNYNYFISLNSNITHYILQ